MTDICQEEYEKKTAWKLKEYILQKQYKWIEMEMVCHYDKENEWEERKK